MIFKGDENYKKTSLNFSTSLLTKILSISSRPLNLRVSQFNLLDWF